jgi:hypothetical protein
LVAYIWNARRFYEKRDEAKFLQVLESGQPWRIERYNAPTSSDPGGPWKGEAVYANAAMGDAPTSIVVSVCNFTNPSAEELIVYFRDTTGLKPSATNSS